MNLLAPRQTPSQKKKSVCSYTENKDAAVGAGVLSAVPNATGLEGGAAAGALEWSFAL